MYQKKIRVKDTELLSVVRSLPCIACAKEPAGQVHHCSTVGSGGDDIAENCMPLCHMHHAEVHQCGWNKFMKKYASVRKWLELANREDILKNANR